MAEIGELVQLSESRVSQMFSSIVERLQLRVMMGVNGGQHQFMTHLARDLGLDTRAAEPGFLPLPAAVISALDAANQASGMEFELTGAGADFMPDEAAEAFVAKMVRDRRKVQQDLRELQIGSGSQEKTATPEVEPSADMDTTFGFTFF